MKKYFFMTAISIFSLFSGISYSMSNQKTTPNEEAGLCWEYGTDSGAIKSCCFIKGSIVCHVKSN